MSAAGVVFALAQGGLGINVVLWTVITHVPAGSVVAVVLMVATWKLNQWANE